MPIDPDNDPNEAYEVKNVPEEMRGPPPDWWMVTSNGDPDVLLLAAQQGQGQPVRDGSGVSSEPHYPETRMRGELGARV